MDGNMLALTAGQICLQRRQILGYELVLQYDGRRGHDQSAPTGFFQRHGGQQITYGLANAGASLSHGNAQACIYRPWLLPDGSERVCHLAHHRQLHTAHGEAGHMLAQGMQAVLHKGCFVVAEHVVMLLMLRFDIKG